MTESTHLDNNPDSIFGAHNLAIDGIDRATDYDVTGVDAVLKISHSDGVSGGGLKIAQGAENAVDLNVCTNINLNGDFGLPDKNGKWGRADQVFTIKGGSTNISLAGIVHSKPTRTRAVVEIGQWSDQSYALSSNIHLALKNADGSSIAYSTGWVKPFSVKANGAKWLLWESFCLKCYWPAKWLVRLVLRIPQGTKGPSWM